jgi:hypothetical protein
MERDAVSLLVALLDLVLFGAVIGYWLGRFRPILRARNWARWRLAVGPLNRLVALCVIALLPRAFARVIWHRIRHGEYPKPKRRVAPTPVVIVRRQDREPLKSSKIEGGTDGPTH